MNIVIAHQSHFADNIFLNESQLGHLALAYCQTQYHPDQVNIDYNSQGQPCILDLSSSHCTIAHSQGMAIAAISKQEVGVDVELVRPHHPSLLEHISTSSERALFSTLLVDELVTTIWIIKESVLKAVGVGIHYPMKKIVIQKEDGQYIVLMQNTKWSIQLLKREEYFFSICHPYAVQGQFQQNQVQYLV